MSLHDELRAAQRCVDDLARCVSRLEQELGGGPEVRRAHSDTDHPRESPEPLDPAQGERRAQRQATRPAAGEPIRVSDAPYDHRLWVGADDEGLGCHRP